MTEPASGPQCNFNHKTVGPNGEVISSTGASGPVEHVLNVIGSAEPKGPKGRNKGPSAEELGKQLRNGGGFSASIVSTGLDGITNSLNLSCGLIGRGPAGPQAPDAAHR